MHPSTEENGTDHRSRWGTFRFQVGLLLTIALIAGCQHEDTAYFQGYVEGEFVFPAASGQGTLKHLFVTRGQSVRPNEPLYQLDPNPERLQIEEMGHRIQQAKSRLSDIKKGDRPSELASIQSRLTQSQSALALAKRDLARREHLYELGRSDTISEEELDRFRTDVNIRQKDVQAIEAELKTAQLGGRSDAIVATASEIDILDASLRRLEWQLDEKLVDAPAVGTIVDILYRTGEFVPAGRPVLSMLPPENLKIRFFVPQSHLSKIQAGSAVKVHWDGMNAPIRAQIAFISPEAEFTPPIIYSKESRTKLVFMIEAVPESDAVAHLHVGQPVEVYLD